MIYTILLNIVFYKNIQFNSSVCKILEEGTKQEGEACGPCFNPSTNFTCGKCIQGLECVPDENADRFPDLPPRCRVPQGKILPKILSIIKITAYIRVVPTCFILFCTDGSGYGYYTDESDPGEQDGSGRESQSEHGK